MESRRPRTGLHSGNAAGVSGDFKDEAAPAGPSPPRPAGIPSGVPTPREPLRTS